MLEWITPILATIAFLVTGYAWFDSARHLKKAKEDLAQTLLDAAETRHEMAVQFGEAKYWMARAQGEAEKAQQAVNFLDHGRVDRQPARMIDTDGFEARVDEDARSVEAAISAESITRGIEALRAQYIEEGVPMPTDADLHSEVEQLFNASANAEGQIE